MDGQNSTLLEEIITTSTVSANQSTPIEDDPDALRIKIEVIIYIIVVLIGGPLNILSLIRSLQAFRNHRAKSQILLLRITLNLADLITIFIYIPKQIIWLITYQWFGGEFLCRFFAFFSTFSFYLNSFVIACIAIDRVFGAYNISSINAHKKAYIRCRNLLIVGWFLAGVLSLPQAVVFTTTRPYPNEEFTQCATIFMIFFHEKREEYNDPKTSDARRLEIDEQAARMVNWEKIYGISHFVFVFWLPCLVIIASYMIVLLILQGHLKQEKSSQKCFKFRYKSRIDFSTADVNQSPTRSTYLFQQDESMVLKSFTSRENVGDETEFQAICSIGEKSRNSSIRSRNGNGKFGAMAVSTIHKAKQHAKRQAALIIVAYLCIWSPYNVFTVLNLLGVPVMEELRILLSFLNAGICINTVVNPIIYGVFRNIKR